MGPRSLINCNWYLCLLMVTLHWYRDGVRAEHEVQYQSTASKSDARVAVIQSLLDLTELTVGDETVAVQPEMLLLVDPGPMNVSLGELNPDDYGLYLKPKRVLICLCETRLLSASLATNTASCRYSIHKTGLWKVANTQLVINHTLKCFGVAEVSVHKVLFCIYDLPHVLLYSEIPWNLQDFQPEWHRDLLEWGNMYSHWQLYDLLVSFLVILFKIPQ